MKNVTNFLRVLMVLLITAFVGVTQAQTPFPLIQQGFNQSSAPAGWTTQVVSGTTAAITFVTSGTYPTCYPFEGSHMVYFNSWYAGTGQSARLYKQTLSTNLTNLTVDFKMYHDLGYTGNADRVQVQYSLNGTTWTNVGSAVNRYDGTTGWKTHNVTLPAAANNQPTLYIGFEFISAYGNNCYFDMVTVMATPPPPSPVSGTVTIGTGTSTTAYPYYTGWMDSRCQLLYTAADIIAGGGVAGNVTALGFDVSSRSSYLMNGFNMRVQQTTATSLATWTNTGWTTVYTGTYTVPATGWQMVNFSTPFNWNGTSNLMVEVCFDNAAYGSSSYVRCVYGATNMAVQKYADEPVISGCTFSLMNTPYYYPNIAFNMMVAASGFGHLTGVVTSSFDGTPIPGATVSVGANNTTTAANGSYMLLNVPIGTQTVNVTKLGYISGAFPATVVQNVLTTLNMALAPQPADLTGIVKNGVDGIPIFGAKVKAGNFTGYSLEDGTYSLTVMPSGSYTVTCSKPGWDQVSSTVIINFPYTNRDFNLFETARPMRNLTATLNTGATAVDLAWLRPTGFYEIIYDDGIQENFTVWATGGNFNALKFTPLMYPASVMGGRVNIGTAMDYPGGNLPTAPFQMAVYDATGANGYPGQQIGTLVDVAVDNFGWIEFMFPTAISIPSGNFYLVMIQGGNPPAAAGIGIDESDPQLRSYSRFITGGGPWLPAADNFMMRAIVAGSGGPLDGDLMPSSEKITASAIPGAIYQHTPSPVTGTEGVGTYQNFNWSTFNPSNVVKEAISGNTDPNQPLNEICSDPQTTVDGGFGIPLEVTDAVLYNNGPLVNGAGQGPGGSDLSIVEAPLIYTGFNFNQGVPYTVADDFTVAGNTWNVTSMDFFGYQTGSTTTSTFTGVFARIWNGVPGATGSSIIWGDLTTNLMASTNWTNIYRTGTTTSTTRPIMKIVANTAGLSLAPGTYWVEWATTGTLASGPWAPPVTISGQPTTGNSLQGSGGTYSPISGDAGGVYPQGLAFLINGSVESSGNMTYQLWRLKQGFETQPATWVSLGVTNSTTMVDNGWPSLPCGPYRWAGKVIYAGNRLSGATFSNGIGKCWTGSITVNVDLTCDSNDVAGTTVQLVNLDYDSTYTAVLTSTGTVTFPTAYLGNYELTVSKSGYTPFVGNYLIMADITIDVMLMQVPIAPTNMFVEAKTLICTWSPPDANAALFDESFSGGFVPNSWVAGGTSWFTDYAFGNPAPSARFYWLPYLTNYSVSLTSKAFTGPGIPQFKLSYDINLDDFSMNGTEHLAVEISTGGPWIALKTYNNTGNMPWTTEEINLAAYTNTTFQIRFNCYGASTAAIDNWYIDNVKLIATLPDPGPCILAYNVYLNNVLDGVTTDTTYTIPGTHVAYGTLYNACVKAVYASGYSDPSCYSFTSTFLWPPINLQVEAIECFAYLTWEKPAVGTRDIHVPAFKGTVEHTPAYTEMAPKSERPAYDPSNFLTDSRGTIAFGAEAFMASTVNFDVDDVAGMTAVAGYPGSATNYIRGLVYPQGVDTYMYGISYEGPTNFYQVDRATGAWTLLGNMGGSAGIRGLTCDNTTGIIYGFDATLGNLYTVDPAVPSYTLVGPFGAAASTMIGMSFDASGNLWGYDIGNDNFYSIDKATGTATTIGSIGFNASYAQALFFDQGSNNIMMAAYNATNSNCEIRAVDVTTGATVILSSTSGAEMTAVAIPITGGGGGDPAGLLGYKVYRDGVYLPPVVTDKETTWYYDFNVDPGSHSYSVSAWYDLTDYGFPGLFDESYLEGPQDVNIVCGIPLPFCEHWDQASFAYNDWTFAPDQGNWNTTVTIGNPAPSADFSWIPFVTDYSYSLTSPMMNAGPYGCGTVWLDFDWKLVDRNATGVEMLTVEAFWGGAWHNVMDIANDGSVDWTSEHMDISGGAGKAIAVRFNANGENSEDILHWYVDNICVYGICNPPLDFQVYDYTIGSDVTLTWSPPDCPTPGPPAQWIHWDDGVNDDAIGTGGAADFDIAARWDASMIAGLDGGSVTKIAFFPASSGSATYRLRVWKGPNAATLLLDQAVPSVTTDMWNIVDVATPVLIDVSSELWVGLNVNATSGWPAGCDAGPAVTGYGDMIYFGGVWDPMSTAYSLDYNWNLQAYIETAKKGATSTPIILQSTPLVTEGVLSASGTPNTNATPFNPFMGDVSRDVLGYNLFRSDDLMVNWTQLNTAPIPDTVYVDMGVEVGLHYYYVTAIFDECESMASNYDSVDVVTGINDLTSGSIMIYPNPATEIVNIKSDFTIVNIEVMNFLGQTVYTQRSVDMKTTKVNVSNLQAGVYFVKVTTDQGVRAVKITVTH